MIKMKIKQEFPFYYEFANEMKIKQEFPFYYEFVNNEN